MILSDNKLLYLDSPHSNIPIFYHYLSKKVLCELQQGKMWPTHIIVIYKNPDSGRLARFLIQTNELIRHFMVLT